MIENGIRSVDHIGCEISREFRRKFGSAKPPLKRDVVTKEEIIPHTEDLRVEEKAIIATTASGDFRLHASLNLQLKHLKMMFLIQAFLAMLPRSLKV